MSFFPLYIDPGTGSALFSIAIGIAAASYFLFRTFILKLQVALFHKKAGNTSSRYKYAIYAEDKRYWAFFEPVLKEFEERRTEVLYITSSVDDPVFSSGFKFIQSKYTAPGNKTFAFLNFLSADIVLSSTPDLDVLQWKRSKTVKHYCHMIHAASGSMFYRLFALDFYDSVLLSGEDEIPEIRSLEAKRNLPEKRLALVGNTYFDICRERIKDLSPEKSRPFTVLVSPSWGPSALLNTYGERLLDTLVHTGWRIIVRPHPQSRTAEKPLLDKLIGKYRNTPNVEWDYNYDNIPAMAKSDVMISDFSGIIYDYVFLFDRPVLSNLHNVDFRPYDAHDLAGEPSYIKTFRKISAELDESRLGSIKETIEGLLQDTSLQKNRQEAKKAMWYHQGESGKRIVDFMIEIAAIGEN